MKYSLKSCLNLSTFILLIFCPLLLQANESVLFISPYSSEASPQAISDSTTMEESVTLIDEHKALTARGNDFTVTYMSTHNSGSVSVPFVINNHLAKAQFDIVVFNTIIEDIINNENSTFVAQATEGAIRKILSTNLNTKIFYIYSKAEDFTEAQNQKYQALKAKVDPILNHYQIESFNITSTSTSLQSASTLFYDHIKPLLSSYVNQVTVMMPLAALPRPKDINCFDKAKILPITKADNIYEFSFVQYKTPCDYLNFDKILYSSKPNSRFAYYVLKNLIGLVALTSEKHASIECRVDGYRFKNLNFNGSTLSPKFFLLYSDLDSGRHYMQVTSLANSKNRNNSQVSILGILANY